MDTETLRDWLRLEAETDDLGDRRDAAEAALGRLLALMPLYQPSPAFAGRVLERLALAPARRFSWAGSWAVRAVAAWCALQSAVLVALWLGVLGNLNARLGPVGLIGRAVSSLALGLEWLLDTARVGLRVAALSQTSLATAGPAAAAVAVACVLASAAGLALLAPMVARPGGPTNAWR